MRMTPWLARVLVFLALSAVLSASWKAGDKIEIKWGSHWYAGEVLEVDGDRYKVHYDGYGANWDEWATLERLRDKDDARSVSPAKEVTPVDAAVDWKAGDRVEAKSYGSWYPATVLEAGEGKWRVTFDGYASGSDAWVEADGIRAVRKGSWKVGDRVEAKSYGLWYAATIIEAEDARWKVKYDGYSDSSNEWVNLDRLRALSAELSAGGDPVRKAAEPYRFPTRPAGAKAGLEGAFLRVQTYYWGTRLSLTNEAWFFSKDGRFSKSPEGGFALDDLESTKAPRKTDGSYWIKDGTITLAWADGSTPTEESFAREDGAFTIGGSGLSRVKGFKQGWRFDGVYEGGASITGMAASSTLVFRKDGTVGNSSVATFSTTSDVSTVSGGSQGESAGTYVFDGFTLTLNLGDGGEKKYTVFAFSDEDAEGRPLYLYSEGTMMKRQDVKP